MSLRRAVPPAILALALVSCAGSPMSDRRAFRGIERAENSVGAAHDPLSGGDEAPAALTVGGQRYTWSELLPALAEAGGAQVIEERMLDTALRAECDRRGIIITPADIEAERRRYIDTAAIAGEQGEQSLDRLRRERGLGPVRFEALLVRTARLRALVRDRVAVNDAAIERAYRQRYAVRYDIRVLVTRSASECQAALEAIRAGAPFSEQALRRSIDPSAAGGGLLLGVSPADLAWPQAIRSALPEMSPGEVRGPINLEQGWTLLQLQSRVEPSEPPPLADVRDELERDLRLTQERVLMDAESRRLLAGLSVHADNPLRWALDSVR